MKLLSTITDWLHHAEPGSSREPQWCRDPLLHPHLQEMDERQLADLPLSPPVDVSNARQAPSGRQ